MAENQPKKRKFAFITAPEELSGLEPTLRAKKDQSLAMLEESLQSMSIKGVFHDVPRDLGFVLAKASELYQGLADNPILVEPHQIISIITLTLSPNALQKIRFPKSNAKNPVFLDILVTEQIKREINALIKDEEKFITLRGPSGSGKSYLLVLYTLILRQDKNYRVLYLNNPEACRGDFNRYIANEIIYAFYRDCDSTDLPLPPGFENKDGTALEKWYKYLVSDDLDADVIKTCIKAFRDYYEERNIKLIFLLDQVNVLHRYSKNQEDSKFVTSYWEIFAGSRCSQRIISASDNNEGYKTLEKGAEKYVYNLFDETDAMWYLYALLNVKPASPQEMKTEEEEKNEDIEEDDDDEADDNKEEDEYQNVPSGDNIRFAPGFDLKFPLIRSSNADNPALEIIPNWKEQEEYTKLRKIIEGTGNHPYELSTILKYIYPNTKLDAEEILDNYFKARVQYFNELHTTYRKKTRSNEEYHILFRIILAIESGMALSSGQNEYDRNLIYRIEQTTYEFKFYSVCPAATKALEMYYASDPIYQEWLLHPTLEEFMRKVLQYILGHQDAFTGSMRGGAFEKLVIDGLARPRKTPFKLTYYQQNPNNASQKDVSIAKVIYFSADRLEGKLLETINLATASEQTLFVPYSTSYGLIDCLLLDHVLTNDSSSKTVHQITLYLLQITINVNGHSKGDITFHGDITNKKKCRHNICKVFKSLKRNFSKKEGYNLKCQFVWLTFSELLKNIKLSDIHQESWVGVISTTPSETI